MSSGIGNNFRIQIFGQSHSEAIGVVIDGLPAGKAIDLEKIEAFLKRRQGGNNAYSTPRKEADTPEILSGIVNGKTCGAPLCAIFKNSNTKSSDYDNLKVIPRPSHADYNAFIKYNASNDVRGGGHFSGRLTLPLCFAGAVCMQLLDEAGIHVGAHVAAIAGVKDTPYNPVTLTADDLILKNEFPVNDAKAGELMVERILEAKSEGDSVGGIIECGITGVPVGLGEPMFDGIENTVAKIVFGIPAVKGLEFGSGFGAAELRGSEHNDAYRYDDNGNVITATNNSGGIIGGISTGMPIIFRACIKPTPSILKEQDSINLKTMQNDKLQITGRHDPCIVPRAVPCIEAAAAIAIYDHLLAYNA